MTERGKRRRTGLDPAFPRLLGERLCLDFANSIENPATAQRQDFLIDYDGLVGWARHVGLLTEEHAARLLAEAQRRPHVATAALARAHALRSAIDNAFHALAQGAAPADEDLATIQSAYVAAMEHAQLVSAGEGFAWAWRDDRPELDRVLWPVARSAVELLLAGEPGRVKACAPDAGGCTWLFYDTSKNRSRRWCSMEGCGSQVKMRRYHARKRAVSARTA
jgi:predicted RNA-binding Zn ribbon-like protein